MMFFPVGQVSTLLKAKAKNLTFSHNLHTVGLWKFIGQGWEIFERLASQEWERMESDMVKLGKKADLTSSTVEQRSRFKKQFI